MSRRTATTGTFSATASARSDVEATVDARVSFMATLRQALEHIGDDNWLAKHSPLTALSAAASTPHTPAEAPRTGMRDIDERLAALWSDWLTREKTPLQTLIWHAVQQVRSDKDVNLRALLLLTYFQDPRPKQRDLIRLLAIGQSTFYRQLTSAFEALERTLLTLLRPSLRLETPPARALVGRERALLELREALRGGGVLSIIGPSGIGKTALAAALYHDWSTTGGPAFWYTFRPRLNDNAEFLTHALALFLHQHGASDLWLHLSTQPRDIGPARALAMIRNGLASLVRKPLLCFDEADAILPAELHDTDDLRQVRAFVDDLALSDRGGAPLLLIGQRLIGQPERGHVYELPRLDADALGALCERGGMPLDTPARARVQAATRGNALLVQLLLALHKLGEPLDHALARLSSSTALDWYLTRLRARLTTDERDLVDALSVFDAPTSDHLWRKRGSALARLHDLGLIDVDATARIAIPPTLRDALYRQLDDGARRLLHAAAATYSEAQGEFTRAARHYALANEPARALWIWHAHRDGEIAQGQARTALNVFDSALFDGLADDADRRAWALIVADLRHLAGQHEAGLDALDAVRWQPDRPSQARMRRLRARLLAMRGDTDNAIANYRAGLEVLTTVRPVEPVLLRVELARQLLARQADAQGARREARLAKHDVDVLLGELDDNAGDLTAAAAAYQDALTAAREANDAPRIAKACELLGILEARRLDVDAATRYLHEAGAQYAAYGNVVCALGITRSNLAFTYMMARRYRDALEPAHDALRFFREMDQPYYIAINEANLAEAYAHLGDAEHAERYALSALATEESAVRSTSLCALGHARRLQRRFDEAEELCRQALAAAQAAGDMWSAAFVHQALAELYRDWGRAEAAHEAAQTAADAYAKLGLPPP